MVAKQFASPNSEDEEEGKDSREGDGSGNDDDNMEIQQDIMEIQQDNSGARAGVESERSELVETSARKNTEEGGQGAVVDASERKRKSHKRKQSELETLLEGAVRLRFSHSIERRI